MLNTETGTQQVFRDVNFYFADFNAYDNTAWEEFIFLLLSNHINLSKKRYIVHAVCVCMNLPQAIFS